MEPWLATDSIGRLFFISHIPSVSDPDDDEKKKKKKTSPCVELILEMVSSKFGVLINNQ